MIRDSVDCELDRAFTAKLAELVERTTQAFEAFNHAQVLADTESFFWTHFTDVYIELAKSRARDESDPASRASAVATLRLGLDVLLRLFAPFIPYIAEEVWSWAFAEEKGEPSIHRSAWPSATDFAEAPAPASVGSFDISAACLAAINKSKADAEVSMGREVETLSIGAGAATLERLAPVLGDVLAAARCHGHRLLENPTLEEGVFEITDAKFAERSQ